MIGSLRNLITTWAAANVPDPVVRRDLIRSADAAEAKHLDCYFLVVAQADAEAACVLDALLRQRAVRLPAQFPQDKESRRSAGSDELHRGKLKPVHESGDRARRSVAGQPAAHGRRHPSGSSADCGDVPLLCDKPNHCALLAGA